ncbi:hypothetical protein ACT4XR_19890 (plasmid) [Acinetobacter baumannii]|uniref:hypothetical protein n=1 Tax=Acinetobacter baumannii TaxID=470 RepID=UPI003891D6AE
MNIKHDDKVILVFFGTKDINLLIPKKRGKGYLKQPIGHFNCPLSTLSRDIGYDFFGLDGFLKVQTGYINDKEEITHQVVIPISEFYGYKWREVDTNTFFDILRINLISNR